MSKENKTNTYTRAQAVEEGTLVDLTETANLAGIPYPVFVKYDAFNFCVKTFARGEPLLEFSRLWELLMALSGVVDRCVKEKTAEFCCPVMTADLELYQIDFQADCEPLDIDDPRPAITVRFVDED